MTFMDGKALHDRDVHGSGRVDPRVGSRFH